MKRRSFILGTGSAAAGGSALIGTGAFSRVQSNRSVTIQAAEDEDAYLGLEGCPDSPNSSYTNVTASGHLEVDMSDSNPTQDDGGNDLGFGVNSNSTSSFDRVFRIRNQGKEPVCVDIAYDAMENEDGEDAVVFYREGARTEGSSDLDDDLVLDSDLDIDDPTALDLDVGESECIGIQTRTHGLEDGDELIEDNEVTIVADVGGNCTERIAPANLEGVVECWVRASAEVDDYPVDTTLLVKNSGSGDPVDDSVVVATLNEADTERPLRNDETIEADDELTFSGPGLPLRAIVAWQDDADPDTVFAPLRDEWEPDGDDKFVSLDRDIVDEDAGGPLGELDQDRYDDVKDEIDGFDDFDDFHTNDLSDAITENHHVAEIDLSPYVIEYVEEWNAPEDDGLGIGECDDD